MKLLNSIKSHLERILGIELMAETEAELDAQLEEVQPVTETRDQVKALEQRIANLEAALEEGRAASALMQTEIQSMSDQVNELAQSMLDLKSGSPDLGEASGFLEKAASVHNPNVGMVKIDLSNHRTKTKFN